MFRIPLPLPEGPPAINVYAVADGDDVVLIDSGWATEDGERHLVQGLERIGFEPSGISRFLIKYGPADRELGDHPREFLSKIFHALSGANRYLDCWDFPSEGNGYLDVLPEPPALPWPWLSEDEFGYYVDEFTRTGFTGGLNWYRADDYVWEQNEELHGRPVTVPTTFIAGAKDPVLEMMGENPFETMAAMVPGLRSTHVIPDVGHFVQMEAADQVNTAMLEFLRGLD